jgi:hypothetical protein
MKKAFHNLVLAMSFASLAFLGVAGTVAQAANYAPPKPATSLEEIREQIRVRDASDGGCG